MNHDTYDDNYIRGILNGVKTIAMVGASPVNVRPSYFAFKYLAERGYDMIPINPGHVGKSLVGKPFVASLKDIGHPIDMIDIFRNSSHIMPVFEEALTLSPPPKVILRRWGLTSSTARTSVMYVLIDPILAASRSMLVSGASGASSLACPIKA